MQACPDEVWKEVCMYDVKVLQKWIVSIAFGNLVANLVDEFGMIVWSFKYLFCSFCLLLLN